MNKYPWMARIVLASGGRHHAGATLVASKYAVTCAHVMVFEWDGSPRHPALHPADQDQRRNTDIFFKKIFLIYFVCESG